MRPCEHALPIPANPVPKHRAGRAAVLQHLTRPPPPPVRPYSNVVRSNRHQPVPGHDDSRGAKRVQLLVPARHASATTACAANTAPGRDASVDSKVTRAGGMLNRPPMLCGAERAPRRVGWSSWKILQRSCLAPPLFQRRGEGSPSTTRGPTRAAAALTQPSRRQNETKQSTTEESFWKPAQIRAFSPPHLMLAGMPLLGVGAVGAYHPYRRDGTFPGNSEMRNPVSRRTLIHDGVVARSMLAAICRGGWRA
ncbi:hypothetical protein CSOJ01_01373 [Colletotrichum sojae]|uniref:Uncharacterized protein n=1 Tax=Colletotrichum sojae TaxID=2175907 RepID=A0A8H6N4L7_9PEZI|nr:hypothetical protein CSOJ01_01373 [Colletotrichum sojae]